jgi:ribosomal subunit interface protein
MDIKVIGSNVEIGDSLTNHVKNHLEKSVKKYFDTAIESDVHFSKDGLLFKVVIVINEGVKSGIVVKSDAQGGDVYGCFNEACEKAVKQLSRYKEKIKNYRRKGGGLKSIDPNYKRLDATKYVLPSSYDIFAEMENEEIENEKNNHNSSLKVISEKSTEIEDLSVDEAIMKMDLANLPALVFINKNNKKINVVYYRKDGNISWIDPN